MVRRTITAVALHLEIECGLRTEGQGSKAGKWFWRRTISGKIGAGGVYLRSEKGQRCRAWCWPADRRDDGSVVVRML